MNSSDTVASTRAETVQLDLPVLLPNAPDEADACVDRLVGNLTGRNGVLQVHVLRAMGDQPANLCIHYDSNVLSLARIKDIAEVTRPL